MERVDEDGAVRSGGGRRDRHGVAEAAHHEDRQELEHARDATGRRPIAQLPEALDGGGAVGVAAGDEHVAGAEPDGGIDQGVARVAVGAEDDGFDVEGDDARVVQAPTHLLGGRVGPRRRVEPDPGAVEAGLGSHRDGVGRGQVGDGGGGDGEEAVHRPIMPQRVMVSRASTRSSRTSPPRRRGQCRPKVRSLTLASRVGRPCVSWSERRPKTCSIVARIEVVSYWV